MNLITRRPYFSKLFVEPTTRCNFRCAMCVKQSSHQALAEGNLSFAVFERLIPAFPQLKALVFSGIGEPLLHPELEKMISLARRHMPKAGWIGFQTNGSLLDLSRARALIEAGTDKICVSVDSASASLFRRTRACGELNMVDCALEAANRATAELNARHSRVGVEFVLMKSNCRELPRVIAWAAERGASFVIATQMLPYHEALQEEVLCPTNMDASMELFQSAQEKARKQGVDLRDYFKAKAREFRSQKDLRVIDLMGEMISEAHRSEIFVHLENLIEENGAWALVASETVGEAKEISRSLGVELLLPALRPRKQRQCSFVENGSAFIAWQGTVHPCYFLWHRYTCFQNGSKKYIEPKSFGDLSGQGMMEIWGSQAFEEFREAVLRYDYPYCGNCNITPCDLISAENFQQDCYGCRVPCGNCPWCLGLLQCLE